MLDDLKDLGFLYATKAGVSIGVDDMVIPSKKGEIVDAARKTVLEVERQRLDGAITHGERHNKIIDIWHRATETVSDEMFSEMRRTEQQRGEFNPIFMMADSGARGSKEQVRQLAGMRGLMSKPSGEVIETPITANFREGLSVLQYFISTHGARKGLADTALKTADSGYLTRRLVDVAQDVIVTEQDCQTFDGIVVTPIMEGGDILEPLRDRIVGRVSQEDIYDPLTGDILVSQNDEITDELANSIQEAGIEQVKIRSGLTCETRRGICRRCYGRNLASGKMVEIGEAVGVIAAESIGEPGTQLTMRTFHVGGTASRVSEQSKHEATNPGKVQFVNVSTVTNKNGDLVVINRNGKLLIMDDTPVKKGKKGDAAVLDTTGREKERYALVYGSTLKVHDGQHVDAGSRSSSGIRSPRRFSPRSAARSRSRTSSKARTSAKRPTASPVSRRWSSSSRPPPRSARRPSPSNRRRARRSVTCFPPAPTSWCRTATRSTRATSWPRSRAPRPRRRTSPAVCRASSSCSKRVIRATRRSSPRSMGTVHHGPVVKGMRRVIIETDEGTRHEYCVPRSVHVNVQEGERVRAGDPLIDGPIDPHDVLSVLGIKELQRYLVDKIQEVYRSQSVAINDKHIEVICRQMLRSVRVTRVGDTDFLVDEQVDRFRFMEENEKVMNRGGEPADGTPLLLGITKASLSTDSFISAASFQETTRVLTEAAIAGRVDHLRGLKENVIVGRLIPAGTGMPVYREVYLEKDEPIPVQPNLEDLLRAETTTRTKKRCRWRISTTSSRFYPHSPPPKRGGGGGAALFVGAKKGMRGGVRPGARALVFGGRPVAGGGPYPPKRGETLGVS